MSTIITIPIKKIRMGGGGKTCPLIIAVLFAGLWLAGTAGAEIVEDFELVRDADNFAWTNLQDEPLALGAKGLTTSSAVKGKKRGAFRRAPGTETYFDEDAEVSVVAIEVSAAEKNDERGTRAVWEG